MPKKTKCPTCGSRKWRKIADGQVVCEDGHVLQGVRSESQVMTEPTAHSLQKRRILKGRSRVNKRKVLGRADKTVYHGRAAEWLRMQGLQLLLRQQVAALRKLWAIPEALEAIARDLWTYQVLMSQVTLPPSTRSPSPPLRRQKSSRRSLADDVTTPTPSDGSDTERGDAESESESESESDNELDADLLALDDDHDPVASDGEQEEAEDPKEKRAKEPWKRARPLRVSDVLVTLALALYILRVPFTFARLEALVNTVQIPYVDFARTTLLPPDMVRRMNRGVLLSLRPQRCPSPSWLFDLTRQFAYTLQVYFDVRLPEVNLPPVAWHVVSELGGTARTYGQVVRVLQLADANMGITGTYVPYERRQNHSEERYTAMMSTRKSDVHMPELSVAAAWVIVMKLAYGLDGQPRLPLISSDPAIGMPKWEDWVGELDRRLRTGAFKGTLRDMDALQFHTMGSDEIDAFLDRAEHVLLANRDHGPGPPGFELPSAPKRDPHNPNSWAEFHARTEGMTQAKPPPPDTPNQELPLLPGEAMRIYRPADTLPRPLAIVVAAAAAVVGVEPEAVRDLVARFERRIESARPRTYPKALVARKLRPAVLRESRSLSSFGT